MCSMVLNSRCMEIHSFQWGFSSTKLTVIHVSFILSEICGTVIVRQEQSAGTELLPEPHCWHGKHPWTHDCHRQKIMFSGSISLRRSSIRQCTVLQRVTEGHGHASTSKLWRIRLLAYFSKQNVIVFIMPGKYLKWTDRPRWGVIFSRCGINLNCISLWHTWHT